MADEFGAEFDELLGAPNILEEMDVGNTEVDPFIEKQLDEEEKAANLSKFDLPIPGQSLTGEPGAPAYEQPPQYTDPDDVADYLFDRMVSPVVQTDILRMLDARIPATNIAETVLLHGAQEGKWSMDMVMISMEPVVAILYGLGERAGIDVVLAPTVKHTPIDTTGFRAQVSEAVEEQRDEFAPKLKNEAEAKNMGLMSRPVGDVE